MKVVSMVKIWGILLPLVMISCGAWQSHEELMSSDGVAYLRHGDLGVAAVGKGHGRHTPPPWELVFTVDAEPGKYQEVKVMAIKATQGQNVWVTAESVLFAVGQQSGFCQKSSAFFIPRTIDRDAAIVVQFTIRLSAYGAIVTFQKSSWLC